MKQVRKIKQIYHPYWDWECWHAGFFAPVTSKEMGLARDKYASFLSDSLAFQRGIDKVFSDWLKSCEHFLSNQGMNRVAFIGQSAMCISHGVSSLAKGGFLIMSHEQQRAANELAKNNLERWLNEFAEKNTDLH